MSVAFWIKTALSRMTPGGYGYVRRLRRFRDPHYDHEREKHELRHKHHHEEGWQAVSRSGVTYRAYESYEEYLTHQGLKLEEILKTNGGFSNAAVMLYRLKFYRRFRRLKGFLALDAKILCAGARQGTEVEVLRDLGFSNASGVDLNPGPDNPWVIKGDFMQMDFPDSSIDLIYSNCVDHAFDLDRFFNEHARVLKPGGVALYDLPIGQKRQPFEAVAWTAPTEVLKVMLQHFRTLIHAEHDREWLWLLFQSPVKEAQ